MHPARRTWWRAAAAVVATAALVPVVAVVGTGTAQAGATVPASFSFAGSGFGHGVGLSQYGARGMALEGATATQIAQHYYTGATVAPVTDSMNLRVNILHARPTAVFRTEALAAGGGAIEVTVTGKAPLLGTPARGPSSPAPASSRCCAPGPASRRRSAPAPTSWSAGPARATPGAPAPDPPSST